MQCACTDITEQQNERQSCCEAVGSKMNGNFCCCTQIFMIYHKDAQDERMLISHLEPFQLILTKIFAMVRENFQMNGKNERKKYAGSNLGDENDNLE